MKIEYTRNSYLTENELKAIEVLNLTVGISDYRYESYEGDGDLVARNENDTWYRFSLGHCSCHGPLEHGYSGKFTRDEMLILAETIGPEFVEFVKNN